MNETEQPGGGGTQSSSKPDKATAGQVHAAAPQYAQIAQNYVQNTKQFGWRFFSAPIGCVVRWLDSHNGLLTALATAAIAVLTYYVARYASEQGQITDKQLIVMKGQLDEMKSSSAQTEKAINESRRLADSAQKSADAAENAQRAWMAPLSARLLHPLEPGKQIVTIIITALNVGREPALGEVSFAIVDAALPNDIRDRRACNGLSPTEGETTIYPSDRFGVTLTFAADFSKTPATMSDIIAGQQILFVMGCLVYTTLGKPHHSGFCFYLYPEIGPQTGSEAPKPVSEWIFKSCPVGNYAD